MAGALVLGPREKRLWQPAWEGTACQVQGFGPYPGGHMDPAVPVSITLGTQVPL